MTGTKNTRRSRLALALLTATMLTPLDQTEAAPGAPIGAEFQVNSSTAGEQNFPAVATDTDGDFVVVWDSDGQDGSGSGVYAQRYNAAGEAIGGEFRVNTTTENEQVFPAVAMDADGDFVVTWIGVDNGVPLIFAQRYDAAGVAQGGEFRVGGLDPAPGPPAVAMNDAGDFVVAWTVTTGVQIYDIFAQRFDAAGIPLGGEFQVSTTSADVDAEPAVAMDADGDFVVAWESGSLSGDRDIFAQRYSAAGIALGSDFRVNANSAEMQVHTAVAMDADGDFVVTWEEWGQYGYSGYGGIFARRYDVAGVAQADEFRVNTATLDDSRYPAVAMEPDGDFVVTWTSFSAYDGWNAFARRYGRAGLPFGGDFRVNATTTDDGWMPAIAMESDGDFVVAWASDDGDDFGIFGRRFEGGGGAMVASDFNADGRSDILWRNSNDGRTVIWQMNGFEKEAAALIGSVPGDWVVEDIGDFDGDGNADILWRNAGTGTTSVWLMNALVKQDSAVTGTVGGTWKVMGIGDFDGGGQADILWHNSSTGNTIIWQMDGLTKVAAVSIGAPGIDWRIKGVDDFSGDGRSDILWRNARTGNTVIWQMDGFTKADAASIGTVTGGWRIESTGDFDADGQADILWRNPGSGDTVIWQMSGFAKTGAATIGNVDWTWQVARVADYNGDGQADILWRNPGRGDTVIWQMNGFTKEATALIGKVSGGWEVP